MPRKKKETLVHLDLETMSQDVSPKRVRKNEEETDNTLGGILRRAREKKKLSLMAVSKKLCIKEMYLEALENGHYYMFPGLAYGVGFLRTYAKFLDLDAAEMVSKFHAETSSIKVEPMEMPMPKNANLMPSFKTILKGISLAIIVYLIWYIGVNIMRPDENIDEQMVTIDGEYMPTEETDDEFLTQENLKQSIETNKPLDVLPEKEPVLNKVSDKTVKETQKIKETLIVTEAPVVADTVTKPSEPVQMKKAGFGGKLWSKLTPAKVYGDKKIGVLSFVATEEVWVKISDGSKTILDEILYKGDRFNVPADATGYTLSTANAGAIMVYVNGKKTKTLGAKGVIAENVALTPENFN